MDQKGIVLVVDDNRNYSDMCKIYLEQEGYSVRFAENGKQGLKLVEQIRPDLIALDLMMPVMDGYQVLTRLKAAPELMNIPVIVLTVSPDTQDVVKAFNLGASDYLRKPFDVDEFIARVNMLIRLKHAQDSPAKAVVRETVSRTGSKEPLFEKEVAEKEYCLNPESGFVPLSGESSNDLPKRLLGIIGFIENSLARFSCDLSSESDLQFALSAVKHAKHLIRQNLPAG
ncbi:MAG: response regulator transcription factor [Deltaproteobacteria bacterium]|nr:response regulator transcription factor [Deltaproteobacteria bacterium]